MTPETHREFFLDALAKNAEELPEPITREEVFFVEISKNIGKLSQKFDEYVKKSDYATKENVGIVRPGGGLDVRNTGTVEVASATSTEILAGTNNYKPIVPANLASAMSAYGIKTKTQISEIYEILTKNQFTLGFTVKNLLKNSAKTKRINGIDFVVNSDGSVTANGTATDVATFTIADANLIKSFNLVCGQKYILSGCSGGSTETYDLRAYGLETSGKNTINHNGDTPFTLTNLESTNVSILVRAGVTVDNVQFFPMLRSFFVSDSAYEPYKPSVEERLTALENAISKL